MQFLSGEQAPDPFVHYAGFPEFRDAHLLDSALPPGSQALYIQGFPDTYPGDVPFYKNPAKAVSSEYTDFVAEFQQQKCSTARLLVMPGTPRDSSSIPRVIWYERAFAAAHEAGEEVRIAWLGDIALDPAEQMGRDNPFLIDYFTGVESTIPRAGLWSVLPPQDSWQSMANPLIISVMNYRKHTKANNDSIVAFEGCAVYRAPFDAKLLAYEQAWRNIFRTSVALFD